MIVVQIGTNSGNDHVLQFCKTHNPERVYLVEPFPVHEPTIRKNQAELLDRVVFDTSAITPGNESEITLQQHIRDGPVGHPNHNFEVTSMVPDHLVKHNYKRSELRSVRVPALSMNAFFKKHGLTRINYLFLDVEGIDFEVLQSIDFTQIDIQQVQIEHIHLDRDALHKQMADHGQYPEPQSQDLCGFDTLFMKKTYTQET